MLNLSDMKSKTLLEALKLKTISQLQESLDMIIDNPNYVTHCTTDFKTLVTILKSGTINTSEKYNAACFSDGFVVRTDAPNQLIQMTTSAKNR